MEIRLYNERKEHVANVLTDDVGIYHVIGLKNTVLSHINRKLIREEFHQFLLDFNLMREEELGQINIFEL